MVICLRGHNQVQAEDGGERRRRSGGERIDAFSNEVVQGSSPNRLSGNPDLALSANKVLLTPRLNSLEIMSTLLIVNAFFDSTVHRCTVILRL